MTERKKSGSMVPYFSIVLRNPRPEQNWQPYFGPINCIGFKNTIFPWKAIRMVREMFSYETEGWDLEVRINPTGKYNGWYTIWRDKADIYTKQ